MTGIELYINNQLCDIENAEGFSIYLRRVLINPSELSVKDAQRSYDINLPATAANNAIFGFTNTEEVRGKFSSLYDAVLYAGSVKIFEGKFKLSEISKNNYKGNLGIPAQQTPKDLFGETKMNEAGRWMVPFIGVDSITEYNTRNHNKLLLGELAPCFFPFVLYGLLPKTIDSDDQYSPKTGWDSLSLNLTLNSLPPSINCLQALSKIFENRGFKLSGTVFNDARLRNLYMSYKNPEPKAYRMEWNLAKTMRLELKAKWNNKQIKERDATKEDCDLMTSGSVATANIFSRLTKYKYNIYQDDSEMVVQGNVNKIVIPKSQVYKLRFDTKLDLFFSPALNFDSVKASENLNLINKRFEVKIVRKDKSGEMASTLDCGHNNSFYLGNQNQNEYATSGSLFFPGAGEVNLIDPKENPNFVCGFSFGENPFVKRFSNPLDKRTVKGNPMAISGGKSWKPNPPSKRSYSAVTTKEYYEYDCQKEEIVPGETDGLYRVKIENAVNSLNINDKYLAEGCINQLIYLEQGDELEIICTSDMENNKLMYHSIEYSILLEPFTESYEWMQLDDEGRTAVTIDWNAMGDYSDKEVNLIKFLPSETKIDDWITNFCKAFNLEFIQKSSKLFELNVKQPIGSTSLFIDLDKKTNVDVKRSNTSLQLPSSYELGFTVDTNEQGYIENEDEKGAKCTVATGSIETKKVTQTSTFSANWFKEMSKMRLITVDGMLEWEIEKVNLPIISEKEVWEKAQGDYKSMMEKNYMKKAQRFWYHAQDTINSKVNHMKKGFRTELGTVSNRLTVNDREFHLNYKTKTELSENGENAESILTAFYNLMTDTRGHYTSVECYLTPEEYSNIGNSKAILNGDIYHIAEVDTYDPLGRKRCKLKLIR